MAAEQQPATGWPTPIPWDQDTHDRPHRDRVAWPPSEWPTIGQLSYTKELITVLLLLLALPWLVSKLVTRPGDVLAGIGRKQVDKVT